MKKVCYTVIMNGYDSLKEPRVVSEGWRYVCFTDDPSLKSKVWEIVPYTDHNRRVKILGHEYFKGITVYVDGSFTIKMNLNLLLRQHAFEFSIPRHPKRNCVYDELNYLVEHARVDMFAAEDQIERYKLDFFPTGYGLGENGILIRDFDSEQVREVCKIWWAEFVNGVKRDQCSLTYCFWKVGMMPYYINRASRDSYFKKHKHL